MSTPERIIRIAHDPDQPEDTPGETVSIVYLIDTHITATLSYDGTRDSFKPYRHNIKIDLGGQSVTEAYDKDFSPYLVAVEFTHGLNDETIDLSVWMDEEHVRAALAIAIRQLIQLQGRSVQGQQEPSGPSSQLAGGPSASSGRDGDGSSVVTGAISSLVTVLRGNTK